MSTPHDLTTLLERITWRDGQMLTSRDLRDDEGYNDRLRNLHIHYQHHTWGVVEGLNVTGDGTKFVLVRAGYALDIDGRELLLPAQKKLAVPNIALRTTMYLVISRPAAASGCTTAPDLATLCPGVKNPVPLEVGQLSWKTVNEVRPGTDVLLARVAIANGSLASQIDTSVARRAGNLNPPLMWSDLTPSGQTGWADVAGAATKEITATVGTSDAGFIARPAYFARLAGAAEITTGFIASASATSFTYVVRPASALVELPRTEDFSAARAEANGWTVAWLGIELQKG